MCMDGSGPPYTRVVDGNKVFLSGEIDDFSAHWVSLGLFELAREQAEIDLIINSGGGNAFSSMAVADAVDSVIRKGVKVTGIVHGHAMSGAVLPLLSCSRRLMTQNGIIMVHGMASTMMGVDQRNLEAESRLTSAMIHRQSALLASKTNQSADEWSKLLADRIPHYYTPYEALDVGLVEEVL